MTSPKRLSDDFFATSQVDPASMRELAEAGFRSVISKRPDGEEGTQPDWATIERAAREAGLEARHIPVTPGAITEEDVSRFVAALQELPRPAVGFCRTGTRSATLWALSSAGKLPADKIVSTAKDAGYDLSPLRERLAHG